MTGAHDHDTGQAPALRALVVVESMFGNTSAIGRAVAEGLTLEGVETETVPVTDAPELLPEGVDLLVLGAPTHAFSLSRASTRSSAVQQGAPASVASIGVREWLGALQTWGPMPRVAVFDTRVTKVRWLPKAAAPTAHRIARRHRFEALTKPASFLVDDIKGPLVGGELARAAAWGRTLGTQLRAATATAAATATRTSTRTSQP